MFRLFALVGLACAASEWENEIDDEALSLIQLRARMNQTQEQNPKWFKKKANGEYGNEVIARPFVDDNICDTSDMVNGAWVYDSTQNCKIEYQDQSIGSIRDGPGDMITGVRFYAAKAGNNGLRFRVYRENNKVDTESEEIEVPEAGVIQEVIFKTPLLFLYGDQIGWTHNGKGNIAYSKEPVWADNPVPVRWRSSTARWNSEPADTGRCCTLTWAKTQHGVCDTFKNVAPVLKGKQPPQWQREFFQEKRTYSYSLITRPATKADLPDKMCLNTNTLNAGAPPQDLVDSLPDAAPPPAPSPAPEPSLPDPSEDDAAAAVGDPHITTNAGNNFDLH